MKRGGAAGQLWQSWRVVCLYCLEGLHTYRRDGSQSKTRAEKALRRDGWTKTAKGWAHKKCHKEKRA